MLIDETEKNFKKGIIVTATVTRIFEDKDFVLCRLDNGLEAKIEKKNICQDSDRIEDIIQVGHAIPCRIEKLLYEDENKFSVILNCKKEALESHSGYVEVNVPEEDLKNINF